MRIPDTSQAIGQFLLAEGILDVREVDYGGRVDLAICTRLCTLMVAVDGPEDYNRQAEFERLFRFQDENPLFPEETFKKPLAVIRIAVEPWHDDSGRLHDDFSYHVHIAVSNMISGFQCNYGIRFDKSVVQCCYIHSDLFRGITPFFPVLKEEQPDGKFSYRLSEDIQEVPVYVSRDLNHGKAMNITELGPGMRKLEGCP
eukprot:GHVU01222764.1.p1 GENE.GHVU01222764.1~~GHVU01222764.1.p1  ORF type:complete len:200 (+),score=24.10 GHVU01222764.1:66-665(+)